MRAALIASAAGGFYVKTGHTLFLAVATMAATFLCLRRAQGELR